jgi:hypothetical protein
MTKEQILEEIKTALEILRHDPERDDIVEAMRFLANVCKEIVAKLP